MVGETEHIGHRFNSTESSQCALGGHFVKLLFIPVRSDCAQGYFLSSMRYPETSGVCNTRADLLAYYIFHGRVFSFRSVLPENVLRAGTEILQHVIQFLNKVWEFTENSLSLHRELLKFSFMEKDKTVSVRMAKDLLDKLDAVTHGLRWYSRSVVMCKLLWFILAKLDERDISQIVHTYEHDKAQVDRMHLKLAIDPKPET